INHAIFSAANQRIEFKNSVKIRGPVRGHDDNRADSGVSVLDDASFETLTGKSTESNLNPRRFTSAPMADPAVDLSAYLAMATPITGTLNGGTIEIKRQNLTPLSNTLGA